MQSRDCNPVSHVVESQVSQGALKEEKDAWWIEQTCKEVLSAFLHTNFKCTGVLTWVLKMKFRIRTGSDVKYIYFPVVQETDALDFQRREQEWPRRAENISLVIDQLSWFQRGREKDMKGKDFKTHFYISSHIFCIKNLTSGHSGVFTMLPTAFDND